jgi:hypothetical protein
MPRICEFHGIAIYMYWDEHGPSHFHAILGDSEMAVRIEDLHILSGGLPRRAEGMVLRWASMHQEELEEDWRLAQTDNPPKRIDPLD